MTGNIVLISKMTLHLDVSVCYRNFIIVGRVYTGPVLDTATVQKVLVPSLQTKTITNVGLFSQWRKTQ